MSIEICKHCGDQFDTDFLFDEFWDHQRECGAMEIADSFVTVRMLRAADIGRLTFLTGQPIPWNAHILARLEDDQWLPIAASTDWITLSEMGMRLAKAGQSEYGVTVDTIDETPLA